jgi:hypothetical protein
MKCSDVEKLIYLFDELEERDRTEVQRHIASCLACGELYQRTRIEKDLLRQTLLTRPFELPNHARLTSNIMAAIHQKGNERSSVFDLAFHFVFSKPVRYGLLTLSLFLGLSFFLQYNESARLPAYESYDHSNPGAATIELNSTSFYQEFNRLKQSGTGTTAFSLHQCLQACQKLSADACFVCKSRFPKLNKQYETI